MVRGGYIAGRRGIDLNPFAFRELRRPYRFEAREEDEDRKPDQRLSEPA
jgi:hypothetical protein